MAGGSGAFHRPRGWPQRLFSLLAGFPGSLARLTRPKRFYGTSPRRGLGNVQHLPGNPPMCSRAAIKTTPSASTSRRSLLRGCFRSTVRQGQSAQTRSACSGAATAKSTPELSMPGGRLAAFHCGPLCQRFLRYAGAWRAVQRPAPGRPASAPASSSMAAASCTVGCPPARPRREARPARHGTDWLPRSKAHEILRLVKFSGPVGSPPSVRQRADAMCRAPQ